MSVCVIVGAGDCGALPEKQSGSLWIAADGGYAHLAKAGITPDVLVGDFDSLAFVPTGIEVHRYPVEKDETDMALAVGIGAERGCDTFWIYGGSGGRLDHTLANIQLLIALSKQGKAGFLIADSSVFTVITDRKLVFEKGMQGTVSVFAVSGAANGVTLAGLKYPLDDVMLLPHIPLGVSNRFAGGAAEICVRNGSLLIGYEGTPLQCRRETYHH